jgi:uncharacterized protein (TIGR00299 family) protein
MKTLYLDIFSGISGDMFLGALLELGVDLDSLRHELAKLRLDGYHLEVSRQQRKGISGTKFDLHLEHEHNHQPHHHHHQHEHQESEPGHRLEHTSQGSDHHHHSQAHDHAEHGHAHDREEDERSHENHHGRNFGEIQELIHRSALSDWVKEKSCAVFRRIAEAEGKIHGRPTEQVHFHEVGAVDSIVDVVGACIALEMLGKPRVLAAPVVEGTGWIACAHGRFPIPAPATLEILAARGVSVSQCDEPNELVTPTGAALLAEFVERFALLPGLVPTKIGYGLGARENKTRPNVLRAMLCESASTTHDWEVDTVAVLQTNLDDINPELLGRFLKTALNHGALDVFHTPVQMKKNRPGVLLTLLCAETDAEKLTELILRETSAFGVRRQLAERRKLRRELRSVATAYGEVIVKLGLLDGRIIQAAPEFESCKRLAAQTNIPLKLIYEAASRAAPLPQ